MEKTVWEKMIEINDYLKEDFICIPPYRITGGEIDILYEKLKSGNLSYTSISPTIISHKQRAYQMEYRYKKCNIFDSVMPVIEYATYDSFSGNYICAYLSLIPVIEAVLRKWADNDPTLSFNKVNGFVSQLIRRLESKMEGMYEDERNNILNNLISYLKYVLPEIFYNDFDRYTDGNHSEIFNRHISLHKLEGVISMEEGLHNLTRIFLLLDVIAEMYLAQKDFDEYWRIMMAPNPEEDLNFILRERLYLKREILSITVDDLHIIENAFLKQCNTLGLKAQIEKLNNEILLYEKMIKSKK